MWEWETTVQIKYTFVLHNILAKTTSRHKHMVGRQ